MIRIVYNGRRSGLQQQAVAGIASAFLDGAKNIFVATKESPFTYIRILKEYDINVTAKPYVKRRNLIGYQFKKVS